MAPLELLVYVPQAYTRSADSAGRWQCSPPPADTFIQTYPVQQGRPLVGSSVPPVGSSHIGAAITDTRSFWVKNDTVHKASSHYRYALPFVRNGIHRRYILGEHRHAPSIKLIPAKNNCLFISIRVLKQNVLDISFKDKNISLIFQTETFVAVHIQS